MTYSKCVLSSFLSIILFFASAYTPLYACSLSFLPGDTGLAAPAIDGTINTGGEWSDAATVNSGDPCLAFLDDGDSLSGLDPGEVTVYTKRRSNSLYIAVDVTDDTEPATSGAGGPISPLDQVMVYLDGNHGRGNPPSTGTDRYYRLQLKIPRDETVQELWNEKTITSAGATSDFTAIPTPAGIQTATRNKPVGDPGYEVEIEIPFSAFGYTLTQGDFGMAVAVVNDLGFQETVGAFSLWQMTGVGLPEDSRLPVDTDDDPIDYKVAGSNWNDPANWGEAFTTGAGDTVYFSHDPAFWKSEDIVTAFCNDRSFSDVAAGGRSTSNDLWYQYDADNVCSPLYTAAKLRREGALVGVEERRVLFLWGEPAMGVREWYYMGHTDPIALDPSTPSSGAGYIYEITDYVDWDGIPAGLSGHPCVLAIALPKQLHPQDAADFAEYAANDTRDLVDKGDILSRYDITGRNNQAQMNIITVDEDEEFTCPVCGIGREGRHEKNFAKKDITDFLFAQVSSDSRDYPSVKIPPKRDRKPDYKLTDAVFDLTGYGIAVDAGKKDYVYVEKLGGIQVVANLDYVAGQKGVDVPVKLVNPTDTTMRVFVNVRQVTPAEETQIGLNFDMRGEILKPGQSMVLQTRVAKTTGGDGPGDDDEPGGTCKPSYCKKCPHKSSDTMVSHAAFLFAGLGGLGLFGYRRKKRKQ